MTSFKEDEAFLALISEMVEVDEKLNKKILAVDERERLEKRSKELSDRYMDVIIELDRIRIRETPHPRFLIDFLRNKLGYGPVKIEDYWKDYFQEILECHQDSELIDRGRFVNNYFKLIPPYVKVGTRIPEGIKSIYHESRWCFVYGQYSAAVSLCRTVIETVLREKFRMEGDLSVIIGEAKRRQLISNSTAWKANKVRTAANRILHTASPVGELEAKNAIDHVLAFLEEIYF